ncbi:amidohydrolase [Maridesulfovibrio bastinii]|uniref:amidohydrolase n=1 Tax=Maridesulfovibrio bastinii TaxID=47157 RepID=UPI000429F5ED|nr:amidohydrolase [Maridesulfovibrio bastinii]
MTKDCDFLIYAEFIVTANNNDEQIRNGCIAVKDNTIVYAGKAEKIENIWKAKKDIKLGNAILLPGLFNSHTHVPMTLLRGVADDLPLMDWLVNHIFPVEAQLTTELITLGSMIGCAEMIASGTVGFLDGYMYEDRVGKVAEQAGIKCVLGEGFFEFPSPFFKTPQEAWETIRSQHEMFKESDLVQTSVAPHSVYTTTPEQLEESFELASELGILWQTHCAESESETAMTLEKYKVRPIELLKRHGLLSPRTRLHHCVETTDEEIDILAESGTRISHNPQSNLKLGSGICPLKKHLDAGTGVGIGTDGAASNNDLDMFEELRTAALLQKGYLKDPTAIPASTALSLATSGSAENLGFNDSGKIEAGMKADIIAVDAKRPHMMPIFNPMSHLVYSAKGTDVIFSMCNGKILYEHGQHTTLDMDIISREAIKATKWVEKHLP